MPPTPEPSAAALLDRLRALPVEVADATCAVRDVPLASYPGGLRPSAVVTLTGCGTSGHGEHVAWSRKDHERLAAALPGMARRGRSRLGAWVDAVAAQTGAPAERAALEAAAIDLALRQAETNLFRLTGSAPRPVRWVASFERRADPVAEARRLARLHPGVGFKIDVDPAWDDHVYGALAAVGTVAVLDFKGAGTAAGCVRAHAALPDALLEDPPPAACTRDVRAWVSLDSTIQTAADVGRLEWRPAAVNVKPARLGGVLEALATIAACTAAGIPVYVGGMFEVDVGRRQLHVLASLFAADGPNDVAPLLAPPPWAERIVVDGEAPGFG